MNDDDAAFIAEIKSLLENATPGEWSAEGSTIRHEDGRFRRYLAKNIRPNDARFVAAAKTAIPRLLEMVEDLSKNDVKGSYREDEA